MNTQPDQNLQNSKVKFCKVINSVMRPELITPFTGHLQRLGAQLLPPINLKTKVTAIAIAIVILPLLETKTTALTKEQALLDNNIEIRNSDDDFAVKLDKAEQMATDVPWKTPNSVPYVLNAETTLAAEPTVFASPKESFSLVNLVIQAGLTSLLVGAIAAFLAKWGISPILDKTRMLKKQGQGELEPPTKDAKNEDELAVLGFQIKSMANQLQVLVSKQIEQSRRQEDEARQKQLFTDITLRIRQSLNVEDILNTTVKEVRQAILTERVVISRFDSLGQGTAIAESVAPFLTPVLNKQIDDPDFSRYEIEKYQENLVRVRNNIYGAGLRRYEIEMLEQFEIKADLVVPIFKDKQVFGLLMAHQCSEPRTWQDWEINLVTQLAIQLGFALDQASLLEHQIELTLEQSRLLEQVETARQAAETARQKAEVVSQEQRQQKESLQHQLLELLADVEEAVKGNLTVRAKVTPTEIGTVADFFNAIIESLQHIVASVKQAAQQVNISVGENSGAIQQLANDALKQAKKITSTLEEVDQMTLSIQAVAQSAHQAATVAHTASSTAEDSRVAMDRTVQSILNLRETVAQTGTKVKRLGESSQKISKVVSLINKIALQTNVLAVNASIEASRAGEEGKGFAVVAEEVSQLATQSAEATKEIEDIVKSIQIETEEVVRAMELGTSQVSEGTDLVQAAKLSLGEILEVSQQIDQLVQSISSATVSQAQTSQSFANLMQEIAKASEHTCDFSRQVSSSLQKTVEVAQQLQGSVGVFKTAPEI